MAETRGAVPAGPGASPGAEALPGDPAQLLTIRRAELAEVRRRLAELRLRQGRIELFRTRVGAALRVLIFAALLFLLFLLALVAIDAARSKRLVVKAFDVPVSIERTGATGETLAALVADELARLRSEAPPGPSRARGLLGREIVAAPAASGSFLASLHSLLAACLGDDIQVSGSLIRSDGGTYRVTVRGDGIAAQSYSGRSRELPLLAARAAGHVFGSAAPAAYLQQLLDSGRPGEAAAFAASAFDRAPGQTDRSAIAQLWAEAHAGSGRYAEAQERARLALSLDPANWPAYATLAGLLPNEEAALKVSAVLRSRLAAAGEQRPDPHLFASEHRLTQDWTALAALDGRQRSAGAADPQAVMRALAEAYRHDYRAADRHLHSLAPEDPVARAASDLIAGLKELDLGRADRAIPPLERFDRAVASSSRLRNLFRGDRCHLALAHARVGGSRHALRLLADEEPARCRSLHGDVLALSGDWPAAERAYRSAIAAAPSLPIPYERAANALLARDQAETAANLFRDAIARGPRWADPRFGLAEALMRLGRLAEAEREYRAAAPLAPRWGALHIGWGEALWRLGRHQEARQVWRAAAGMELSAATRLRLRQLLALAA